VFGYNNVILFHQHLHMVFICCSWFDMKGFVLHTISFNSRQATDKQVWAIDILQPRLQGIFCKFYGRYNAVVCQYSFPLGQTLTDVLKYQLLSPSLHADFDFGLFHLPNLEMGLTAGVSGWQRMVTPPWHLIPPLVCLCPVLICISCRSYEIDHCCCYLFMFPRLKPALNFKVNLRIKDVKVKLHFVMMIGSH
jgi:hypothetical protein